MGPEIPEEGSAGKEDCAPALKRAAEDLGRRKILQRSFHWIRKPSAEHLMQMGKSGAALDAGG